jgi:phosphoribosylglycinamide formyltransferase 1
LSLSPKNIAIFASGAGTNAQKIIDYFKNHEAARVSLIVTGNPKAGVVAIAEKAPIPLHLIEKQSFTSGTGIVQTLKAHSVDFIVLAGFLWKVPLTLISTWPGKIVNIHPALLPKFGGAGMYGRNVYRAVMDAKETESGITIHYVDELYDHGKVIFQARFNIEPGDTVETIAEKTHQLEHKHYPVVIEQLLCNKLGPI